MATKVILPKQGLQMTEGTITKWLIKEGQKVKIEEPLFEMETDKLNIEIISPATGTLLKIIRGEGQVVPITKIIAVIGEPGEDISEFLPEAGQTAQTENKPAALLMKRDEAAQVKEARPDRIFITPRAKALAAERDINITDIDGSGPDNLIIEKDIKEYVPAVQTSVKATPLAARIAVQKDIKLEDIAGSGARGKITKSDVEAALASRASKAAIGTRSGKVIPYAGMRKVISDRMMQSVHGMAQANHRMKVDMSELVRFREKLKEAGIKVSFNDIIVKVVSKALFDFPIVNSTLVEDGIRINDFVNMGIAVAVENGLIVPVIKNADLMTLEEISVVSAELIEKVKKGELLPEDYTGGTFTVTNLGMFDIDEFTAIINPPESAILAIGKIDKVPVVEDDKVVIRPIMVLSLTYDHRIIDGAPAAQFLQRIKQIIQNPYLLI